MAFYFLGHKYTNFMRMYQSNATHTPEKGVTHTVGTMTRLVLSFTLLLSLVTLCHADCCWDSDGYAINFEEVVRRQDDPIWKPRLERYCDCKPGTNCQPDGYGYCSFGRIPTTFRRCVIPGSGARYTTDLDLCEQYGGRWFCLDGTERVGSYCNVGKCNAFGCNCDGGCIGPGGKRRLMQAKTNTSLPSGASSASSVPNLVGQCQDKMIKKYNTTTLQEPEQIKAYFDCLDLNSNGMLDGKDESLTNTSIGMSDVIKSLDSNGNGGVDPPEFDADLAATTADTPAAGGGGGSSRLSGSFVIVSLVIVSLVAQNV